MSVENNNRKITKLPFVPQSGMTNDDLFVFVHDGVTSRGTLGDVAGFIGDSTDTFSTGGTYNETGGTITISNNMGGSFDITGITSTIYGDNGITIQSGDTVELGGALTKFTTIDGNNQTFFLGSPSSKVGTKITWANFISATAGDTPDTSATWTLTNSTAGLITGMSGETQVGSNDATLGQATKFIINHGDAVFEDSVPNSAGLKYAGDYSTNYEPLSLVTYQDLTGNTLNSGSAITVSSGGTIDLGGALSNATNYTLISGGGNHILDLGQNAENANLAQLRVYGQSTLIDNLTTYAGGGVGTNINSNPGGITITQNLNSGAGETNTVNIAGSSSQMRVVNTTNNRQVDLFQNSTNTVLTTTNTSTGEFGTLGVQYNRLTLGLLNGSGNLAVLDFDELTTGQTTSGKVTFTDNRPVTTGIEYADDYISGFTDNTLVTKGYVDINENNYWFVDSINGDDNDVEQGNRRKAYKTIAAAESGATAGETIKIIADIQECGLGKDGLTYILEEGVKLYFPASESTPAGLSTGHLWSDTKAGVAISFVVYGGYHEAEGNWYGNSDRGIIANHYGSDIRIYDAEKIFAKGTSQDLILAKGTGGNTEMYCNGDIISGLNGLQFHGGIDSNVVVSARGRIQTELRKIAVYNGSEGNTVLFEAGSEIISLGHSISGLRSTLYGNTGNASNPEHWILKAPRITYYDPYPNLGSNNGAFLFGWNNFNLKLDVVAEILTMSNIDPETYTNEAGLLALNYGGSASNYDVRLDVGTIVLGKGHEFDDTSYTPGRTQALVKLKNCEIVTMSDLLHSGNVIDTNYFIPTFEGVCKLIINPDAITAGQKAIGSSGGNDAWVMGYVITNGDYYDANFTDKFSGLIGGAITNIKVNDTSEITDFTKYNNIL